MKTNLPVFGQDGEIEDYSALKLSVGELPLPTNMVIEDDDVIEGGVIEGDVKLS